MDRTEESFTLSSMTMCCLLMFPLQIFLNLQQQQQQQQQFARGQLPGGEQLAEPGLVRRHGVQLLERGTGRRRLPGKRPLLLRRLQERLLLPR